MSWAPQFSTQKGFQALSLRSNCRKQGSSSFRRGHSPKTITWTIVFCTARKKGLFASWRSLWTLFILVPLYWNFVSLELFIWLLTSVRGKVFWASRELDLFSQKAGYEPKGTADGLSQAGGCKITVCWRSWQQNSRETMVFLRGPTLFCRWRY